MGSRVQVSFADLRDVPGVIDLKFFARSFRQEEIAGPSVCLKIVVGTDGFSARVMGHSEHYILRKLIRLHACREAHRDGCRHEYEDDPENN